MSRPLLLDLFCGAGGAAVGYHRAGFDVIGVDIKPQPRYPFRFIRADAIDALKYWNLSRFAAIHASPVCMTFARVTDWRGSRESHPDTLTPVMDTLAGARIPWVVENVPEAPLRRDLVLCGSQFGLKVQRHRVFQTSWGACQLTAPCGHRDLMAFEHKAERAYADAMGCGWMTTREARQAIPPAYTEHVGQALLDQVAAACTLRAQHGKRRGLCLPALRRAHGQVSESARALLYSAS